MALLSPPADLAAPPAVPSDARRPIYFGVATIIVAFGSLLLWSALAPLAKGVVASGSIVVDSNRKAIQHLEGGIISEILVRDGDIVAAGQVLLRLDQVTPQAQRDQLYSQYLAALAREARLLAERDQQGEIAFPALLKAHGAASREASLMATEAQVFTARRDALAGQLSIYEQRIKQLEEQIGGLQAQVQANDAQIRLIDDEIGGLKELFEKGYAAKTRILELERRRAELVGGRGGFEADIARATVSIGEARLQIIQLRKTFEEEVAAQLQETQQQKFDVEDRLTSANHVLKRLEVKAPTAGIIVGSVTHTVGGVISPGQMMMEIVPLNDKLIVEAMVNPIDIDVVAVGLEAEVRFSSLASRQTPSTLGQVAQVAADVTTDPQGNRYYTARVEVPEAELSKLNGQKLVPGMPVEVMVKAGERSVLEYLLKPLTDSFFRAFKEA